MNWQKDLQRNAPKTGQAVLFRHKRDKTYRYVAVYWSVLRDGWYHVDPSTVRFVHTNYEPLDWMLISED